MRSNIGLQTLHTLQNARDFAANDPAVPMLHHNHTPFFQPSQPCIWPHFFAGTFGSSGSPYFAIVYEHTPRSLRNLELLTPNHCSLIHNLIHRPCIFLLHPLIQPCISRLILGFIPRISTRLVHILSCPHSC